MSEPISSIDDLVSAFGGTGEFAQWLDVVPSTVSNWKALDHIPNGYHLRIYLECERRRLKIDKGALFGMADPLARRRVEARA